MSRNRGINASPQTGFYAAKVLDRCFPVWYLVPPAWKSRDEESQGNPACPGMVVSVKSNSVQKTPALRILSEPE